MEVGLNDILGKQCTMGENRITFDRIYGIFKIVDGKLFIATSSKEQQESSPSNRITEFDEEGLPILKADENEVPGNL